MNLDGPAIGGEGEGEEGGEGDGEEGVDEEDVLTADGLSPGAGVDAEELLDGEVEGELLGLVQEEDWGLGARGVGISPGSHGAGDEAVDVGEQQGVAGEGEGEGVEALVERAQRQEQQRVLAQQRADGRRVAALHHGSPLPAEHQPVELRVCGEHRALAEHVRREEPAVPPHPLGDEGLGVLRLVGRDQLERLPDQRQPHAAGGQLRLPPPSPGCRSI